MQNAMREQYLSLTEDEKRTVRKEKFWSALNCGVLFIAFFTCVVASVFFLKKIPNTENAWLEALIIIGKTLAGLILIFISCIIAYWITFPLRRKAEKYNIPLKIKKEIFHKACKHLRDYYGLQEPYIITKCFDSTDAKFKNHDVCIFIVGDELRITTDLINGFLYGSKDLGCYAFKRNESAIAKKYKNNRLIAELKANDTVFLLGYRAKAFIEKNFTLKTATMKDG